jgi:hypothetical protein
MTICFCADQQCPCGGKCICEAEDVLYRIDMEDDIGTPMCDVCASDAMDSGLFLSERDEAWEYDEAVYDVPLDLIEEPI